MPDQNKLVVHIACVIMRFMKKALLLTGVVAVTLAGAVLVLHHYKQYKNHQIDAQVASQQLSLDQQDKRIAAIQKLYQQHFDQQQAQIAKLQQECQKGQVAYDKLTPYTKTKTASPVCN